MRNVVFLHAHNTGRYVEPYGYAVPTPVLRKFAAEGTIYRQAFCASPTCSPSRGAFLTGMRPLNCGMIGLGHRGFHLTSKDHHIARWFSQHGYQSLLAGIEHIGTGLEADIYDRVLCETNDPDTRKIPEAAANFIRGQPEDPFFLSIGLHEAHREYPPPDPDSHPAEDWRFLQPPRSLPDVPAIRQDMAGYIAAARKMDEHIGIVLDALEESGLAEDTLVFIFADHGLQFPRHMCNLTDHGLGVFLLARYPHGVVGPAVEDRMVSLLDLFPTACEVTGIPSPPWLEGHSLLRLAGNKAPLHEVLFGEINYHAAYEPARSIRTPRYKYIRRYGSHRTVVRPNSDPGLTTNFLLTQGWSECPHDQEALYDLIFDPDEANNRAGDPGLKGIKSKLRAQLEAWMQHSDDPLLSDEVVPAPAGAVANDPNDSSWLAEPHLISP